MMPPICCLCRQEFDPATEGELVAFSARDEDLEWTHRADEEGFTGHPPHQAWFCAEHCEAAKAHQHLTLDVAMEELAEI